MPSARCMSSADGAHDFQIRDFAAPVYCDTCGFSIWDRGYACRHCKEFCHAACRQGPQRPPSSDGSWQIRIPERISTGSLEPMPYDMVAVMLQSLPTADRLSLLLTTRSFYFLIQRHTRPYDALSLKHQLLQSDGDDAGALRDGEHTLYHKGYASRPFAAHIVGLAGLAPEVFIALPAQGEAENYSVYHPAWSGQGERCVTRFRKLRINPVTLMVKTDDYTFATSCGRIVQSYWNGQRTAVFESVPYATARGCGAAGSANVTLTGTPFAVASRFALMGCRPRGAVTVGDSDVPGQVLELAGDGFCGRLCPAIDVTKYEQGKRGNYDDEGVNGGWVLQLTWANAVGREDEALLGQLVAPVRDYLGDLQEDSSLERDYSW